MMETVYYDGIKTLPKLIFIYMCSPSQHQTSDMKAAQAYTAWHHTYCTMHEKGVLWSYFKPVLYFYNHKESFTNRNWKRIAVEGKNAERSQPGTKVKVLSRLWTSVIENRPRETSVRMVGHGDRTHDFPYSKPTFYWLNCLRSGFWCALVCYFES